MNLFNKRENSNYILNIEIILLVSVILSFFITLLLSRDNGFLTTKNSENSIIEKYRIFLRIGNIGETQNTIDTNSVDNSFIREIELLKNSENFINRKKYSKAIYTLSSIENNSGWITEMKDNYLIKALYGSRKFNRVISLAENKSDIYNSKLVIKSYLKTGNIRKARKLFANLLEAEDPRNILKSFKNSNLRVLIIDLEPKLLSRMVSELVSLRSFSIYNKIKRYIADKDLINYYNAEMYYAKKRYNLSKKSLAKISDGKFHIGKTKLLLKIDIRENRFSNIDENLEKIRPEKDIYKITLLDIASILKIKGEFELSEKYYKQLLNIHDLPSKEVNYWKALWRIGWMNMKSGKKDIALKTFKTGISSPITSYKVANLYWEGKLNSFFKNGITDYPYSYYYSKYIAGKKILKKFELKNFIHLIEGKPSAKLIGIVSNIEDMLKYGYTDISLKYIKWVKENSHLLYENINTIKVIESIIHLRRGNFYMAFSAFTSNFPNYQSILLPKFLSAIYTPIKYKSLVEKFATNFGVDKNIVFALIKRESFFNKDAYSPAKAIGLMQLLSKTAKRVSKNLRIKIKRKDIFKPEINIKLGTYHLKELLNKYNGKKYLALAAYNAGAHRVDRWIKEYNGFSEEEFIEMIPFSETRNYVKKVLRNYFFYNYYYN